MEENNKKSNALTIVSIATSIVALATATATGFFQYLSSVQANKISTQIESIRKRDEKAIEFTNLILSENEQERLEGLLKLSIIYRETPEIEKEIIKRVNALKEIDKKNYLGEAFSRSLAGQLALPVYVEDYQQIDVALRHVLEVPDITFISVYNGHKKLLASYVRDKSIAENYIKLSNKVLDGMITEFGEEAILQQLFFKKRENGLLFYLNSISSPIEEEGVFDDDSVNNFRQAIGYLLIGMKYEKI